MAREEKESEKVRVFKVVGQGGKPSEAKSFSVNGNAITVNKDGTVELTGSEADVLRGMNYVLEEVTGKKSDKGKGKDE